MLRLSLRRHGCDLVGALAVVAIAVKVVAGVGAVRETLFNDESIYLASGVRMLVPGYPNDARGLPSGSFGPLYSCWYFVLHLFEHDLTRLYFLNWSLLVALVCLAQYALQRALGGSVVFAMLTTFLLATSRFFDVWPYVAHFAALVVLVGATVAVRARSSRAFARCVLWTLLAGAFVRPELALAFVFAAVSALVVGAIAARRRTRWRSLVVDVALVALPAAILGGVFGNPMGGTRAFYAWGQHYAVQEVMRHQLAQDPWLEWYSFVQRDFGSVNDLSSALRANPAAFLEHFWLDALASPHSIYEIFEPGLLLPPSVERVFPVLMFAFVALGVLGLWRRPSLGLKRALALWVALSAPTLVRERCGKRARRTEGGVRRRLVGRDCRRLGDPVLAPIYDVVPGS